MASCAQDIKKAGFSIADCVNVEVAGPVTVHHALWSLPFTQGTITDITNDAAHGYTWTVQVPPLVEYPASRNISCTASQFVVTPGYPRMIPGRCGARQHSCCCNGVKYVNAPSNLSMLVCNKHLSIRQ